jgi:predicted alpha/beta superfamily hydrolase
LFSKYSLLLSLIIASVSFHSQASELVLGEKHFLNSLLLKEQRELQIYLPESYQKGKKNYPVIFVMDSQRYFLHAIAHQQSLRFQDKTPELIVIGIKTDDKKRRQWLSSDSEQFMSFLKVELIPWVEKKYRTSSERLYFGWEMAAGLVPDLITKHPALFQAFFMASPTHIDRERVNNINNYLLKPTSNHYIYATLGEVETWATASMQALEKVIISHSNSAIEWEYDLMPNQDHHTTPLITIDNGLLKYFNNYGPLRFYTLKEFDEFGGIKALKKHYAARAKRFEISPEIHDDTKHYLLNQTLIENDFQLFAKLADNFEGFIASYYTRDFWFERFANAYIELGDFDNSLKMLKLGVKKLPDSPNLYVALGSFYHKQSNFTLAKSFYEEALTLTSSDEDSYKQILSIIEKLN